MPLGGHACHSDTGWGASSHPGGPAPDVFLSPGALKLRRQSFLTTSHVWPSSLEALGWERWWLGGHCWGRDKGWGGWVLRNSVLKKGDPD